MSLLSYLSAALHPIPSRGMANVGEKRRVEEYNVSEIVNTKKAKVHCVITSQSPICTVKKSNRRYFQTVTEKSDIDVSYKKHLLQ